MLEHIRSTPGRRIPQMADRLGIPAKTIERWIADLKRHGRIEYRGSKKAGRAGQAEIRRDKKINWPQMDADERRWDKKVKFIRVYLRLIKRR